MSLNQIDHNRTSRTNELETPLARVETDHLGLVQDHMNDLVADVARRRRTGELTFGEASRLIVVYRRLQVMAGCERLRRERPLPRLRPVRPGLFLVVIDPAELEVDR